MSSYPSMTELLEGYDKFLSKDLQHDLNDRWDRLSVSYLSDQFHEDGRPINKIIFNPDIPAGAREEVVDTVFNVLVLGFKGKNVQYLLTLLQSLYSELQDEDLR